MTSLILTPPDKAGARTRIEQVKGFEIRRAAHGDKESVIALVSKMWGQDITSRYDWFYLSNPHGRALTWVAIESESGDVVGCTSIFPRKVVVDGRVRMGSIGGDCYIEPRARRKGLATAMHRESFAGMRDCGIEFMYGPPNPNNLAALVKAGSRVVTNFRRWARPLTGRAVYRAAFSRTPSKLEARLADFPVRVLDRLTRANANGITLERVMEFGPEFDAMFDRAVKGFAIACVRDSDYLSWRYLASPFQRQVPFALRLEGELVGFVGLETFDEQAVIADLFTVNDSKLIDAALQTVLNRVAEAGCSNVDIGCTPGSVVVPRLRRSGFIGRAGRAFQVAVADDDPQIEKLLTSDAWHFMASDEDLDTDFSAMPE